MKEYANYLSLRAHTHEHHRKLNRLIVDFLLTYLSFRLFSFYPYFMTLFNPEIKLTLYAKESIIMLMVINWFLFQSSLS